MDSGTQQLNWGTNTCFRESRTCALRYLVPLPWALGETSSLLFPLVLTLAFLSFWDLIRNLPNWPPSLYRNREERGGVSRKRTSGRDGWMKGGMEGGGQSGRQSGRMARWFRHGPHKWEGLNLDPYNPNKYSSVIPASERRNNTAPHTLPVQGG